MALPNFLIVGAAKSGTTSLFDYLGQHPDVFVPPIKEPCYFSSGQPQFVRGAAEYAALFQGAGPARARGEASTSYLYDPQAAQRISTELQRPHIFILLRNPADRAYASWGHNTFQVGYETLPFAEALAAEDHRVDSPEFERECPFYAGGYHYFRAGLYHDQVRRYIEGCGRQRVRVYITEEFARDPAAVCRDAYDFLEVEPSFEPHLHKRNAAPGYRHAGLQRFLSRPPAVLQKLVLALPMTLRTGVYRTARAVYWRNQTHRPRPPLDAVLRAELLRRYEPDINALEALLDRDLGLWREVPA